jgi:hypothetical protein
MQDWLDMHVLRSQRWRFTLKCLAALVAVTAAVLFGVDRVVLASIGGSGPSSVKLNTQDWQREDALINANNKAKILPSKQDWLWSSRGFPVSRERKLPHRILVVGDSFVWGDGYANMNDIWWRQLERELRRRGYAQVDVMAIGRNGASTRQELEHLREALPRYRPDLVIWSYVANDADEGLVKQFNYARLDRDDVVAFHRDHAETGLPRLQFQLQRLRREKLLAVMPGEKRGYEYHDWELRLVGERNLVAYKKTLGEVAAFMREADTPFFFITLPNYLNEAGFEARYAPLRPVFAEAGIELRDVLPDFVATHAAGNPLGNDIGWGINPANGHPNTVATRFYAVEAADVLEAKYPSVLGPRSAPVTSGSPFINDWMPAKLAVQSNAPGQIRFAYPTDPATMLRMPIEQSHVQLNLALPSDLRALRLRGPNLASAQLHLTHVDPQTGIDSGATTAEPEQRGDALDWELAGDAGRLVNTVRVVAEFDGADRSLTLDLVPVAP